MPELKTRTLYIGIDPGMSGGLAFLSSRKVEVLVSMPSTERDIWDALSDAHKLGFRSYAIIERVHSMPGQGVASSFKFGSGYGGLRMALTATEIPFEAVTPRTWMKGLSISPRKKSDTPSVWKNKLKAKAQELFPEQKITLKTSDALLIAEYCRRLHTGRIG